MDLQKDYKAENNKTIRYKWKNHKMKNNKTLNNKQINKMKNKVL